MIIAIALGIIGGIVGVVPFIVVRTRIRTRMKTDGVGGVISGMAATIISFFIILAEIVLCKFVAENYLLPFAMSAIVVFILAMGVYTATLMRR